MDASKILNADWLDILFDGRNKSYGAYDLRKTYAKRLGIAIACLLLILGIVGATIYITSKKSDVPEVTLTPIKLTKVKTPERKKEEPKPEKKKEEPKKQPKKAESKAPTPKGKKSNEAPVKLATKRYTPPKIVEHPDQSKKLASMKDLLDKKIATFDQEGMKTDVNAGAVLQVDGEGGTGFGVGGGGTGNIAGVSGNGTGDGTEDFKSVQVEASYDGDFAAFLRRNLRETVPIDNGAPRGRYTVRVQFKVSKDGSLSEIKALNDPGYGTADEAMRAIRASKKWKPAMQNGRAVTTTKVQAITFDVQSDE